MFGADLLSETDPCIATRQNKMAAPDVVSAHRIQNQLLKQAPLAFYEKFPVWKSCHFGRHFRKRSHQMDRCIARTNHYRVLPESGLVLFLCNSLQVCKQQRPKPAWSGIQIAAKILTKLHRFMGWTELLLLHSKDSTLLLLCYFIRHTNL